MGDGPIWEWYLGLLLVLVNNSGSPAEIPYCTWQVFICSHLLNSLYPFIPACSLFRLHGLGHPCERF